MNAKRGAITIGAGITEKFYARRETLEIVAVEQYILMYALITYKSFK